MLMERCPLEGCNELMPQGAKDCGKHQTSREEWGVKHRVYSESVIIDFISRISATRTPYDVQRDPGMPTAQNVLNRCAKSPKLKELYQAAVLKCYPDRAITTCACEGCNEKRNGKSKYCLAHQQKANNSRRAATRTREDFARQPGEPKPHHEKAPSRPKVMTIADEIRLDLEQEKLNKAIDRRSRTIPAHINKEMLAARVMRGAMI